MSIIRRFDLTLDGGPLALEGGARERHLMIPAGYFTPPFWLRIQPAAGDPTIVHVTSLPWRWQGVASQIEALSTEPTEPPPGIPDTPTGFTATVVSTLRIDTACDPAPGAGGYRWYRDSVQVGDTEDPAFSHQGLAASTQYSLQVSAYNAEGESVLSAALLRTTHAQSSGSPIFTTSFEGDAVGGLPTGNAAVSFVSNVFGRVDDSISRTGSKSLRFRINQTAIDADYNNETRFNLATGTTKLWLEYYSYFPTGNEGFTYEQGGQVRTVGRWVHGHATSPSNNKYFRLWGIQENHYTPSLNKIGATMYNVGDTVDGVNHNSQLGVDHRNKGGSLGSGGVNSSRPEGRYSPMIQNDSYRGRWIQQRWYSQMFPGDLDEFGNARFECKLWFDGVLLFNMNWYQAVVTSYPYWNWGYIYGWSNSGAPWWSAIYVDDLSFYTGDPGW